MLCFFLALTIRQQVYFGRDLPAVLNAQWCGHQSVAGRCECNCWVCASLLCNRQWRHSMFPISNCCRWPLKNRAFVPYCVHRYKWSGQICICHDQTLRHFKPCLSASVLISRLQQRLPYFLCCIEYRLARGNNQFNQLYVHIFKPSFLPLVQVAKLS